MTAQEPDYLTGNPAAINAFIDKFDIADMDWSSFHRPFCLTAMSPWFPLNVRSRVSSYSHALHLSSNPNKCPN
ncbi:hypothetical protein FH972_023758 [Carpinus fangiana]|uniref:Uncharacterized protein n=1 Tax=Carpinus fangiana TaxID=176857 RepID=A0A5N6KWW6_9ROSI|nr:hypothetical protein FH972_023758 [Carpinus fangiana]